MSILKKITIFILIFVFIFYGYDFNNIKKAEAAPTGGTITTDGNYTVHTFTTDGIFTPVKFGNIEVLVVAGGGSGGGSTAGGGGAGGLIYEATHSVSAGAYSITVGAGGAGAAQLTLGNNGSNSIFDTLTAIGGGGGGYTANSSYGGPGQNGGSGGGGAIYSGGGAHAGGLGTVGQGNDGGNYGTDNVPGGGGGGAGAVGQNGNTGGHSGNGGVGLAYSISGTSTYYAGGGGGGSVSAGGAGGLGGGGAGTSSGTGGGTATANTGGGGGGGWYYSGGSGGAGGSGIVIVRYLTSSQSDLVPSTGLSCSLTTAGSCSGTILLRMSGSTNAHAELPSQSTANYDNNVVCCTGVTGLGNSCASSNKEVFARLSGVTNAHVEKNSQSNPNYTQNACLSSLFSGDEITVGYQASNCTGYDTTLFSMLNTPTNSQVGGPSSYNNKVCAKIFSQSISFDISDSSIGFGNLNSSGLRYATGDGVGSASEIESYNIKVSTNAPYGYGVYLRGDTLKSGAVSINAIGGTNMTPSPGSNAFGLRAVATGGVGVVSSPYSGAGFAYDSDASTDSALAGATSGDGSITTYSVRTVATIDSLLNPGDYSTNLTYIVTANF